MGGKEEQKVGHGRNVLPYLKVEKDTDFQGPFHGNDGNIPCQPNFSWIFRMVMLKHLHLHLEEAGFKYLEDQNGKFEDGYFPVTGSFIYEKGFSSNGLSDYKASEIVKI